MSTPFNTSNGTTNPSLTPTFPNISSQIEHKMDGTNYLQWLAQIVPLLRSFELMGFVDGLDSTPPLTLADQSPNPTYKIWYRRDQHVLSLILASLTVNVVSTVYCHTTSKQVWTALASQYSAQSRS
ncbi:hypothetical protein ABFS83_14G128100 [Erythranthe nasuta]